MMTFCSSSSSLVVSSSSLVVSSSSRRFSSSKIHHRKRISLSNTFSRRTKSLKTRTTKFAIAQSNEDGNVKFANNKEEWEALTAGDDGLIAVQISTKTCGPCKVIYPTFVGLSEEFPNESTFVKIMGDTDAESRALMKEWGVRVVPLFMLWKEGKKIAEWSGAKPEVLRENIISAMN